MPKRGQSITEEYLRARFPTPGKRASRKLELERMMKTTYAKQKSLEVKMASNRKELGMLNQLTNGNATHNAEQEAVPNAEAESSSDESQ